MLRIGSQETQSTDKYIIVRSRDDSNLVFLESETPNTGIIIKGPDTEFKLSKVDSEFHIIQDNSELPAIRILHDTVSVPVLHANTATIHTQLVASNIDVPGFFRINRNTTLNSANFIEINRDLKADTVNGRFNTLNTGNLVASKQITSSNLVTGNLSFTGNINVSSPEVVFDRNIRVVGRLLADTFQATKQEFSSLFVTNNTNDEDPDTRDHFSVFPNGNIAIGFKGGSEPKWCFDIDSKHFTYNENSPDEFFRIKGDTSSKGFFITRDMKIGLNNESPTSDIHIIGDPLGETPLISVKNSSVLRDIISITNSNDLPLFHVSKDGIFTTKDIVSDSATIPTVSSITTTSSNIICSVVSSDQDKIEIDKDVELSGNFKTTSLDADTGTIDTLTTDGSIINSESALFSVPVTFSKEVTLDVTEEVGFRVKGNALSTDIIVNSDNADTNTSKARLLLSKINVPYSGELSFQRNNESSHQELFLGFSASEGITSSLRLFGNSVVINDGFRVDGNDVSISGTITSAKHTVTVSDSRKKQSIEMMTSRECLDVLSSINAYKYSIDGTNEIGLIAQEFLEVLPEVIHEDSEGFYGIKYQSLIPILIGAIKELSNKKS